MKHDDAVRRFEDLVANYGHVIRAAIRGVAGSASASIEADVEQRVLMELWKQVSREQKIDYPSSYVYRAAVRETIRLARKVRKRSEVDLEARVVLDKNPNHDPERRAFSAEMLERLNRLASGLLEDRRQAVIAHLAGYRVQEIMETHGWTYNRARNLIARGIADLRQALEEEHES